MVIPITVNATDDDGTIEEVQYIIDNVRVGSATSFPYVFNWNSGEATVGSHTIMATSKDNNGGTASDEVTINLIEDTISNFEDTIAPTATLAGPNPYFITLNDKYVEYGFATIEDNVNDVDSLSIPILQQLKYSKKFS